MADDRIQYRYTFRFEGGATRSLSVTLDRQTLGIVPTPRSDYPAWTALQYMQCPGCPLDPDRHPRCPIAANMVEPIEMLKDWRSFDAVDVTVEAGGRKYTKRTTLQEAGASFLGIFMVGSGCPSLNRLRPMLATHLPFMSTEESTYRTISMYLTAQYFRHRRGETADWSLKDLLIFLRECRETNSSYCARIKSLRIKDAALNALASLNAQGEVTFMSVEAGDLDRLEGLFSAHFAGAPRAK